MDQSLFETYLRQTQQIAQRLPSDPSALLDIMQLIEKHKLFVDGNTHGWDEFFKGEFTFYSGQYEKALHHYLAAKDIPHYHFFCFRTSCFVARTRGDQEQAVNFAKKALKLNPNDEILKQFLHDLSATTGPKPAESAPKISLGEKEMAELASIFEEPPQQHEELFSREFDESKISRSTQSPLTSEEEPAPESRAAAVALEESPHDPFLQLAESSMNAGAEMFSSTETPKTEERESLAQRLYALSRKPDAAPETPLSALRRLAEETPSLSRTSDASFAESSGLAARIEAFQQLQSQRLQEYLNYTNTRPKVDDNALFVLNGWDKNLSIELDAPQQANTQGLIFTEQTRKSTGGLFLRWNGKGIVINPGAGFLNHFHGQGFSLQDIHAVVVTQDHYSAYADIKAIYELNNKLNKLGGDLQIIHYYLNQRAYQELTTVLKPNFKQARNTVHSLELFIDSPDVEKIEISDDIVLHYFLASSQEPLYKQGAGKGEQQARTTLGVRLELRSSSLDRTPTRLGYVSGAAWSPLLAHHLGVCEVLVAGFGNTSPTDYTKTGYQEDSLGYHGTYSLLEEIAPRLFVSTEFGGREGDIRLEAIKKLRQDIAACGRKAPQETTVIPGDIGLYIDLKALKVQCSVTHAYIEPQNISIAKSTDSFGRLLYLSPSCYL